MLRDAQDAREYLQRHIAESQLIRTREYFVRHSYDTGRVAKGRTLAIKAQYTEFEVEPEEMEMAGILHDLGKCFTDDLLHETIITADYLEAEGMPRIAATIRTHFTVKEILEIERSKGKVYNGLDPEDFEPRTWNEVILAYGDLHSDGKRVVTFEERMEDLFRRHGDKEVFAESMRMAMARLSAIRDDVDALASGGRPELIEKYGFI